MYVFWGWPKAWKLECSNESSWQHTASEGASNSRLGTGLADTAGAGRWVWNESVPMENPRRSINLSKAIFKRSCQALTTCNYICITGCLLYCGIYEYRHLVGDVSAVCSVYATSWYPLLVVLMLVFDRAGID